MDTFDYSWGDVIFLSISVIVLLAISALFSGSETALTVISRARIHKLAKNGSKRAGFIQKMQLHLDRLIGSILLGNTLVNICATSLTTGIFMSFFGESGIGLATLLMTFLILTFAEIMPKTYAIHAPEKLALSLSPVIYVLYLILTPFVNVLRSLVRFVWKVLGVKIQEHQEGNPKEDLAHLIEMYGDLNYKQEMQMLRSILDLSDVTVREVMLHRKDIISLNGDLTAAEALNQVTKTPHSRFPVFYASTDNVIGTMHMRTLWTTALKSPEAKIKDICRKPAWFVPETKTLIKQLQSFRARKEHMAFVVDEYGDLQGLITLEDVLEEIVGDILDEYDVNAFTLKRQRDGSFLVDAHMTIRDFNKALNLTIPDDDASTLAGLILHEAEDIPARGKVYHFHNLLFEVIQQDKGRLLVLKVTHLNA